MTQKECPYPNGCPRSGNQQPEKLLAENRYLATRVDELEAACNLAVAVIQQKDIEIAGLQEELTDLKAESTGEKEEIYKPNRRRPKGGRVGAPLGHPGGTRKKPAQIDKQVRVYLSRCPHCNGRVKRCQGEHSFSDHTQEDIQIITVVTCYRHYKYYCKKCQKQVTGIGEKEIPKSYLGPEAVTASGILHYAIGLPYNKITDIYRSLFGFPITTSALIDMDKRITPKGLLLYSQLEEKIKKSSVSYTDETGWRVDGVNHWLWHAGNKEVGSLYRIKESRGHQVAKDMLGENYPGVLVSDCFSAYNLITASAKQKCLAHLFRDIEKITKIYPNDPETIAFSVNLENILREGLDLKKGYQAGKYTGQKLEEGKARLEDALSAVTSRVLSKRKAEALRKRFVSHQDEIFTFLSRPEVEPTNNFAERQIRPAVVMRKNTGGSRSGGGAERLAVMMSLIQTEKLQGKNPKDLLLSLVLGNQPTTGPP